MQHKKVFDAYHQYIIQLTKKGVFQGLRIDHIDGLADPKTYLQRLRNAVGKDCYIVVEKILEAEEELPTDWPIDGTTGYDFLAIVNNLLTNRKAEKPFNKLYREMIDKNLDPSAQMILKKRGILLHYMQGELNHLVTLFLRLVANEKFDESTMKSIKTAIADFLIYCPVYRFYGNSLPLPDTELAEIRQLLDTIPVTTANSTGLDLLTTTLAKLGDEAQKELLQFYQRLMQFSGPLMAKGVEDTLMYTYNRFIGHGEVGDSPAAFGIATEDFHQLMMERQNKIPFSINATATHDTKRGEDVRARLNVLTDLPSDWRDLLMTLKGELGIGLGKKQQLHQNDIYLVLQTIIGVLPYAGQNGAVGERLNQYLEKALREAKKRSDWANPNQTYEQAVMAFAAK
ncbi:MAG: 4-alpha-glucanotransferase, partial [Pedobacter sp.]